MDCCLPDWVWVVIQMIFGGGLGGLIFQTMQVQGPDDVKLILHPFMVCRAIFGGICCAFGWMFLYIHMGKMPEITLDDLQIITIIIYSMVAGFIGLLSMRRMRLWA